MTPAQLVKVARIQLVNARMVLGLPLLVLACVLAANIVIFMAIQMPGEPAITGALVSVYIVTLVTHIQTMTQMFPFALGISVTRRDFVAAAGLVVVGQALLYGVIIWVMALIEGATGGWGLGLAMFDLPFLQESNVVTQVLVYAGPFLLLSFAGLWAGIVFHRWGQLGVWVLGLALGALLVGLMALVGSQGWWQQVFDFFAETPTLLMFAGYPTLIAAILAAATYATSRRAVP
ncbi:hypothetical protein GCM10009676_41140 [Prauserella halophila]|uniref:ABC transporter permease n=1 Tax=Prauserella halophila TaxID=185641 RepID=A0ABP4H5D8_9PSEU|nr:hypothetical protein [Prauserella halophila]MCP2236728.1 hypothetical protein [Prauserella halophila]